MHKRKLQSQQCYTYLSLQSHKYEDQIIVGFTKVNLTTVREHSTLGWEVTKPEAYFAWHTTGKLLTHGNTGQFLT